MSGNYLKLGRRKDSPGDLPYAQTQPITPIIVPVEAKEQPSSVPKAPHNMLPNAPKIPTLGSVPPARGIDIDRPVAERVAGVRSVLAMAMASVILGATGTIAFNYLGKEKDSDADQTAASSAVALASNSGKMAPVIQEPPALTPQKIAEDAQNIQEAFIPEVTGLELVDALRQLNRYPVDANFDKPVRTKNKYMKAIKLVEVPIAPYPGALGGGTGSDSADAGYIYEWKILDTGNGYYTRINDKETIIAIKFNNPAYAKLLRFEGAWKPVAKYDDTEHDITILLYDNCTVDVSDSKFDERRKENMKINYPKRGGYSSIVITDPDNPKKAFAIYPLKIYPCTEESGK